SKDAASVDLTLKIPQNSRAEIVTGSGTITAAGLADTLALRSVSGEIQADLSNAVDVDIIARSKTGVVRSEVDTQAPADEHSFQARLGTGKRTLRANSQSGAITLSAGNQSEAIQGTERAPELQSVSRSHSGAGTPANQQANEEFGEGDTIRVDSQLV